MKVRFHVDEIANVMTQFDKVKVFRSTIDSPYSWTEITGAGTRVSLVASTTDYLFDDTNGDVDHWYCTSYYNSSTTAESPKSDPMKASESGYVTVDDMRDEGYTATEVTDAQIRRGALLANDVIEKITGQWFEPRLRTFLLDGRGKHKLFLDVPIITVSAIEVDEEAVTLDFDTVKIYNRHLTQGLTAPDDRYNPMLVFDESFWQYSLGEYRIVPYREGNFYEGQQNVKVTGYFGFTDLAKGAPVGETSSSSQVPLDYGDAPDLIKYAARRLCARYMYPLASQAKGKGTDLSLMGRIKERKNRDQAIKFGGVDVASSSLTGDPEVDEILSGYMGPLRAEIV